MIENSIYMQYILTWNLIIGVVKFFAEWFFAKNSREEKNNSQRIWRLNFPREDVAAAPRAPSNYPTMQTRKWGRRAGGPPFGPTRQPLPLAPLTVSTSEVGPEGGGPTYGAHPSASPASPVSGIPIRAQRHARPTRPPTWTGPTCRTSSRAVGSHPPRPIGRPGWSATSGPPPPHHRLRLRLFFFFSLSLSLSISSFISSSWPWRREEEETRKPSARDIVEGLRPPLSSSWVVRLSLSLSTLLAGARSRGRGRRRLGGYFSLRLSLRFLLYLLVWMNLCLPFWWFLWFLGEFDWLILIWFSSWLWLPFRIN